MKTISLVLQIVALGMVLYIVVGKKQTKRSEKISAIIIGILILISLTTSYLL